MAGLIALLALSAVCLIALAGRDEPDKNTGVAVLEGGARTPFGGGALPAGISGRAAPRVALDDACGGRVDTRRLKGRPYV